MVNAHKTNSNSHPTRREKVEQKEARIIGAARELFIEQGYSKTSIAEIAKSSGIADGTVYTYFKNKKDLGRAVLRDFFEKLSESVRYGIRQIPEPHNQIKFFALHHMKFIIQSWALFEMRHELGIDHGRDSKSQIYTIDESYFEIFDTIVMATSSNGDVSSDMPHWMLRDMFFGSMDYGIKSMLMRDETTEIDQFADALVAKLFTKDNAVALSDNLISNRLVTAVEKLEILLSD